jgi:Protein of unknown function (DUF1573)
MRLNFLFLLLMCSSVGYAQVSKPLRFSEEIFDFGMINEQGGPVMHEFSFMNNSSRPIKIINVQASCGCTTPDWTKEAVEPGKSGFIQASYNPIGRPGYFNKSLTITTDFDPNPLTLQIKGQVAVEGEVDKIHFQASNGNLKLRSGSFNMGKIFIKDEFSVRDFQVMNGGTKPLTFSGKYVGPAYIKIDIQPKTLQPGEKGNIKVSYNGKMKGKYGFQADNVEIFTDDELNSTKSFSIYATLEDEFPQLNAEELAKAPQLRVQVSTLDFGKLKPNTASVRQVQFYNTGKKELDIKSLQGNCTCITASIEKESIKPGESASITISLNPQDRKGSLQKALTIYSNDPQNPVQRITFSGYVE